MTKSRKKQLSEIRFSPLSLLCLLFCWVGVCGLVFYLGVIVGRMEQRREIRKVYGADEGAVAEEEFPYLSFEEDLLRPEEEQPGGAPEGPKPTAGTPVPKVPEQGNATQKRVLQVASFRKPEYAEQLVRELRKKGYRCFKSLPHPSRSGDEYSRVFVGPLLNQERALKVKARLEEQEGYKGILVRSVGEKEAPF